MVSPFPPGLAEQVGALGQGAMQAVFLGEQVVAGIPQDGVKLL